MTTEEREMLVAEVMAADVACPESVCDWVIDAADHDGIEAGRAELARAVAIDAADAAKAERTK